MTDPRLFAALMAMRVPDSDPQAAVSLPPGHNTASQGGTKTLGELTGPDRLAFDTEPVIGWRAWRVVIEADETVHLHSCTYQSVRWHPLEELTAECIDVSIPQFKDLRAGKHEAPCRSHTCGIYVTREERHAYPWGGNIGQKVIGTAALWGHVVPHLEGWRGKYAYPQSLFVPDPLQDEWADIGSRRLAMLLRQRYAVDVDVVKNPQWTGPDPSA